MSTATFTELLRTPKTVLEHVDEGPVRITRRDGDDLVILRGDELDTLEQGVAFSSVLLRAIGRHSGDAVAAVRELYAWTTQLADHEVSEYAAEMERLVYAASELGRFERLLRAQSNWRETALAYAEGYRPTAPVEVAGQKLQRVPCP